MEAAKAGAGGGTVVHARGLGSKEAKNTWVLPYSRKRSCPDFSPEGKEAGDYGKHHA